MLEGNLAEFLEEFTDDEFRLLTVFIKNEFKMPNAHAGTVAFISRDALANKIDKFWLDRFTNQWPKTYAEVSDLLTNGHVMLKGIQRKIERRTFRVTRKAKKRKFTLTLYKDGAIYTTYRCKTVQIAKDRGMIWATGRKFKDDGQARDSKWCEPSAGGTLDGEAA